MLIIKSCFWNSQERHSVKLYDAQIGKNMTIAASNDANNIWVGYENEHATTFDNKYPFKEKL
ncbi:MAG: hypothetical protein DK304_000334 [Chloroflexi bacterium]|jgi:hypothetical protein|nr:MAG: hypothetical protein DK304_000334 [Chloroflexota bacterium]